MRWKKILGTAVAVLLLVVLFSSGNLNSAVFAATDTAAADLAAYRQRVVSLAQQYWDKVVPDGFYMMKRNQTTVPVNAGDSTLAETVQNQYPDYSSVDCAHFVSACIGLFGGGLALPSTYYSPSTYRDGRIYGILDARKLASWLLNDSGYAKKVKTIGEMEPGDVIVYYRPSDTSYHSVLYLGNQRIASHSSEYASLAWDAYLSRGFEARWLIHITAVKSLSSLTVNPSSVRLKAGESVQLRAVAVFRDKTRLDVTGLAIWEPRNSSLILTNPGQVLLWGSTSGYVKVTYSYGGVTKVAWCFISVRNSW